jgi:transposase-like protein
MYDYEDYFYEPSENDIVMSEIGDILKKMIKKEVLDELEALRAENAKLRQFRDERESYEAKIRDAEYKCKVAIEKAQREAKNARIHSLFGEMLTVGYMVASNNKKRPKCNKCNDQRRIEYVTPLGRHAYEVCDCEGYDHVYEVKEVEMVKFTIRKRGGWDQDEKVVRYFSHARNTYDDQTDENNYDRVTWVYNNEPFEELAKNSYYGVAFLDKDKCQEYCDWCNAQKNKEN